MASNGKSSKKTDSQSKLLDGNLNAMVLDLNLFLGALGLGVYLTLDFSRHPLSESTLLNNCDITYVINDVYMLDKGTFIKECPRRIIEARTSSLLIIGHDTCMIKSILNGKNGKVNLVLRDVIVVKGFYVNIVFEALLYKKGTWYHGYDSTLRIEDEHESNVLLIITRIYNIVFIEYKPLLTYLNAPFTIPISASNVFMYFTLEWKIKESFKRNKKYLQSRSDIEKR
jgi:hypothetical protein